MFFETLFDIKPDTVPLHVIPKTNEEYISFSFGCIRFIDSYRFLPSNSDGLVDELSLLKRDFPSKWGLLNKTLAYPHEYFKSFDDYDLQITNLVTEDYFSN